MVLNTPSAHLLSAIVAVICLRQHLCMAFRACDVGLFNLGSAYHAEIGLGWKVLVACVTSVDYYNLMPAVLAKPSIHTNGCVAFRTGHILFLSLRAGHGLL